MAHSVVARFSGFWRTAVLAVAIAVLLVAFTVDIDPVVRFGIGGVVFVLWMWWFVTTGAGMLGE